MTEIRSEQISDIGRLPLVSKDGKIYDSKVLQKALGFVGRASHSSKAAWYIPSKRNSRNPTPLKGQTFEYEIYEHSADRNNTAFGYHG